MDEKFCRIAGHEELTHIRCRFGWPCGNLNRVANGIDHNDSIHVCHGDGCRNIGKGDQGVRNGDDIVCILGIDHGIAQDAAVTFSADGTAVSHRVTGGGADEGHINVCFP